MSNAKKKDFKTMIGGQALIEGIMMRGPEKNAAVVRGPDRIEVKETDNVVLKKKYPIVGLPIIRGAVNFALSMAIGMKALSWSAEFYPEDEGEPSKFDKWMESNLSAAMAQKYVVGTAMVLGVALAILFFTVLPTLLGSLASRWVGSGIWRNLIETCFRLLILICYMLFASRMNDIKRVFSYHGAEHKTIACYEAGQELTVENVRRFPRKHPRCGTSFLFTVVIISLVVFMWVSWDNPFIRVALRLSLLPVTVGISYEINHLVGKYDNALTRFLRKPGLWLQNITTLEPDDSMIEIGIEALKRVLPDEKGADTW